MSKNIDIADVIECINDGINKENILTAKQYFLNLKTFSNIIAKRKKTIENYLTLNNSYNKPKKARDISEEEYSSEKSTPNNDSISVSPFTLPSDIYKPNDNDTDKTDRTNF